MTAAARLRGVVKRFGRVTALAGADLEVRAGEIHGVLGENGAGKTTLLGVLAGLVRPDQGAVEVGGAPLPHADPRAARRAGVGLVHQHFALASPLSVLENLALGVDAPQSRRSWRAATEGLREAALSLMSRTGMEVPLDAPVAELSVGERQRVEILRTLLATPSVLALDEPTAVLGPFEVKRLFTFLRREAEGGRAVILVAHKLDEVLAVADRLTVLRGGRTILQARRGEVPDQRELVRAMVGHDVQDPSVVGGSVRRPPPPAAGDEVARLDDAWLEAGDGRAGLCGASLSVRRGEIVGVAGVEGNGQRELALVLAGRAPPQRGRAVVPAGVGYVPRDRTAEGVVGSFDLAENMALTLRRSASFRRAGCLRWGALRRRTEELMRAFDIRAPDAGVRAAVLSGGNQQRLVVARELEVSRDLLVAEDPTRGLDVAAAAFVHEQIRALVAGGSAAPGVVLISSDLDEVLQLSHRIVVLVRGRIVEVPPQRCTRDAIGSVMLGAHADA